MKFRISTLIIFLLCLLLCYGQVDTNRTKKTLKNQATTYGTKADSNSETKIVTKVEGLKSGNKINEGKGQSVKGKKSKNADQKQVISAIEENKEESLKEIKNIPKKEITSTIEKLVSNTNGIGIGESNFLTDTVKSLTEKIYSLNRTISKLEDANRHLTAENNALSSRLEKYLTQPGNKASERNLGEHIIDKLYYIIIGVVVFLIVIVLYFFFRSGKKLHGLIQSLKKILRMNPKNETVLISPQIKMPVINTASTTHTKEHLTQSPNQPVQSTVKVVSTAEYNKPKSFSNINYKPHKLGRNNWFVVGASSIGKSHITSNINCQDNHLCSSIKEGWGIAVSCDGAGSAEHSDMGSNFVSVKTVEVFEDLLRLKKFVEDDILPDEEEWQNLSNLAFRSIYNSLSDFAKEKKIEFNSVACTVTVVVFTPLGLLSSHIGDGRAGYCNANGEWKSLITPHKGEEANQTIFITSSAWVSVAGFKMSDVLVPECRVVSEKAIAFTLMSDGCETHSFDCSKMDSNTNKWIDLNQPSEKFFNPLLGQLKSMHENRVSLQDINSNWIKFIEGGTAGLKDEPDDKTLILGILI